MMKRICSYCQKASPKESNFCVHCGIEIIISMDSKKEGDNDELENIEGNRNTKIFSTIFNIIILLAAIASIGGFIFFYVENKINTPVDKNPTNEQIVDNLYRNTKYKFRIKFPELWEIKKGDGLNVLVKTSNSKGSNINIVVKDLGVEFGDIDEMMTIEEWAEAIIEEFPSAKIISKRQTYIDNRIAFFAQYSTNYKALDNELDMIFYNVSVVKGNYLYAITAGSVESEFALEKQTLDQAVQTFVFEESGTNNINQGQSENFQSDQVESAKDVRINRSRNLNRPWFRNSLHGISFETPLELELQSTKPPVGYEDYIDNFSSYASRDNNLIIFFMYAESKFNTYDTKTGLEGSISNMVNSMNGTDLILRFSEPNNQYDDDLKCNGSFKLKENEFLIKGYVYWNGKGKGKFFILTATGNKKDLKAIEKVIDSIIINIP